MGVKWTQRCHQKSNLLAYWYTAFCLVRPYCRITRGYKLLIITLQLWRMNQELWPCGPCSCMAILVLFPAPQIEIFYYACMQPFIVYWRVIAKPSSLLLQNNWNTSHTPASSSRSNFWRGHCFTMERHTKMLLEYASQTMVLRHFKTTVPSGPKLVMSWFHVFKRTALTCCNSNVKPQSAVNVNKLLMDFGPHALQLFSKGKWLRRLPEDKEVIHRRIS